MQREGISTFYICSTLQEPFCLCLFEYFAFFALEFDWGDEKRIWPYLFLDSIKCRLYAYVSLMCNREIRIHVVLPKERGKFVLIDFN